MTYQYPRGSVPHPAQNPLGRVLSRRAPGGSVDSLTQLLADFRLWTSGDAAKNVYGQQAITITEVGTPVYHATNGTVGSPVAGRGPIFIPSTDADFFQGGEDFTLELFGHRFVTVRNGAILAEFGYANNGDRIMKWTVAVSGTSIISELSTDGSNRLQNTVSGFDGTVDARHDLTFQREGDSYSMFEDGILKGSYTRAGALFAAPTQGLLSLNFESTEAGSERSQNDASIEGVRYTKGLALYDTTRTHTPPDLATLAQPPVTSNIGD